MFRSILIALVLAAVARAAGDGEVIDRVWSGHPVSFALLVERGHQFIAYYDAERRITVVGRAIGEKKLDAPPATWCGRRARAASFQRDRVGQPQLPSPRA